VTRSRGEGLKRPSVERLWALGGEGKNIMEKRRKEKEAAIWENRGVCGRKKNKVCKREKRNHLVSRKKIERMKKKAKDL